MTMEIELAKRDFVKQLWEETENDPAARDLLFGEIMEAADAHGEVVADQREDEIRDEVRDDVKEDLINDPPDDLRAKVIGDLIEDPPSSLDAESWKLWLELEGGIKKAAREDVEDQIGDLELTIEGLREEIARLKGEKYESPKVRKAKKR